jgi:hypothetical protein
MSLFVDILAGTFLFVVGFYLFCLVLFLITAVNNRIIWTWKAIGQHFISPYYIIKDEYPDFEYKD